MTKKLLSIALGLFLAVGIHAQVTVNQSDVAFWTGTGSNSTLVAIGWDDASASYTPTVVVWGVHWNGTITLLDALDTIAAYDERFTYTFSGSMLGTVSFINPDAGVSLTPSMMWNCNSYGGAYGSTNLVNGTWLRISESTCNDYNFSTVNNIIYPANPSSSEPSDELIAREDILFWVGHGPDSATVVINWVDELDAPTTYAWGLAFDDDEGVVVSEVFDSLSAYDPRFYHSFSRYMGTIHHLSMVRFVNDDDSLYTITAGMNNYNCVKLDGYDIEGSDFEDEWIEPNSVIEVSTDCYFVYGTVVPVPAPSSTPATPVDALVDFSDILYWVGSGSDSAALIVNFGIPDTAFAWGYLFNSSATVQQMTDAITAADPRFTAVGQPSLYPDGDIFFVLDNGDTLSLSGRDADNPWNYWEANINGEVSYTGAGQALTNGDVFKYGDQRAPTRVCLEEMSYGGTTYCMHAAWTKTPTPVAAPAPAPVEATIAASDILYWVGEGSNEVVMAVNWPDTALAWGYRFNGTKTVSDMMSDIAAADPRFSYSGTGFLSDITFNDGTVNLSGASASYWESKNNSVTDAGMSQTLANGDFEKWANSAAGVVVDSTYWEGWGWSYIYAYPMAIHPVSVPDTTSPAEPIVLCDSIYTLPYSLTFSEWPINVALYQAGSTLPDCWTVLSNGRFSRDTTPNAYIYLAGITTATSTNNYGCITPNDPFFSIIATQHYTGTNQSALNDMLDFGTRKFAILPMFDQPLSQSMISFDYRTSNVGALLLLGYIVNDTSDFVVLDSMASDYRVLHNISNLHFESLSDNIPDNARLTFCWMSTSTSTSYPSNLYCGIDNLTIDVASTPTPVEATIAAGDILYWVGSGSDSAIFVISDGVNTRAWGYLFDETDEPTALDMASDIAEADPRLVYTITDWTTYDMGFIYREYPTTISIADTRFKVDGVLADAGDMLSDYDLLNGSVVVISSDTAATWTTPIVPATVQHMPVNSTIDPEDILYWVGEGVNEAVVVVNWGVPDTALAWGLRFTNATSIGNAIDAIAAADPRVTTDAAHSTINYTEGNINLSFQPAPASYMQFILGDNSNVNVTTLLDNGDQLKIGESAYGTGYDSIEYMGMWYPMGVVWNTTIQPVCVPDTTTPLPQPVDATIAFDDILWWIGEGSDSAALIVNFAQPDTAFAWGVLFNGTTNGEAMLNAVVAADSNLSISDNPTWGDGQIYYTLANGTTLSRRGTQWKFNINGVDSWGDEDIFNGDVFKFGDPVSGEQVGTFQYNWYKVPTPVAPQVIDTTTPEPQPTTFCGAVGTEGCNAIAQDSNCIVAWATAVELTRGPQLISNPNGPLASFGGDTNAIGPATPSNTMDAVSLGDGGSALVTFAHPIRNGEGPDFAVFENSFGDFFLELAFVEVSTDGERFVRFPATSLTQTETQTGGMGSTDPTKINNLAGKFRIGWGTPFDLEELRDSTGIDIDNIVYVRIVDVVGSIDPQYATYDAYGHIVNDPWPTNFESSGFDLTGVAVMYERIDSIPVTPRPDEATIAANDILYWVGTGSNEVVMAVNWADTALAWGYRFNGTKCVGDMMNDIAAADPRFSIVLGDYGLEDILFAVAPGDTLRKQAGSWWESKNNGITDAGMAQTLNNGDFEKWTEPAAGVVVDSMYYDGWGWSYVYVYPMEIHPVSAPTAGIAEVVTSIESLWPNPTTDRVNVTASRAVTATLFDCTGRELHTYSLQQGTNVIDLTAVPAGVYFLRADGVTARVIKR